MAFRIRYSSRAAPGAATAVLLLSFLAPTSQTSFLYTYKLPTEFTDGAKLPIDRSENPWTTWYDVDQAMHPFLEAESTINPDEADLYYIPVYTAQLYHSLLLDQKLSHADSLNKTAEAVRSALHWVKHSHPYWNRTNGLNHFAIMGLDHGRCSSMAGLTYNDFGDMFTIQPSGDQILKDFESHSWHCYRQGRDVLLPTLTEARYTLDDIVKPWDMERYISVLYRFAGGGRGNYGMLRSDLLQRESEYPILGSVSGWQTVENTYDDMKHSIFCVCPPGIAQQTLRVWRAIISGCIPVTLFIAHDNPYERLSNLDYSTFSVNINPHEWHLLRPTLVGLLARPDRISALQAGLGEVQAKFLWDRESYDGAFKAVLEELILHPARFLGKGQHF